jgi:hypothetical protein
MGRKWDDDVELDEEEEAAEHRAQRFLYRHLSRWQRKSLRENGYFMVKGNHTGDKYRVYFDGDDSVFRVRDDCHFCLSVMDENEYEVPEGDRVLARKLLIQGDEETFLAVANRTPQP